MEQQSFRVKPINLVEPQAYDLSQLDQITLRIYGRNLFFFGLAPNADIRQVFELLRMGLSYMLSELPVFAGEIVTDPTTLRMRYEQSSEPSMTLHYRDLRKKWTAGTFEELQKANFPMSAVAPVAGMLIGQPGLPTAERVPVSDAVVSFIPGGLILGLSWHHGFTGVEGRATFLERWSKHTTAAATHGQPAEFKQMSVNALDRSLLSPPASDTVEFPNWLNLKSQKKSGSSRPPPANSPELVGSLWQISASRIAALKKAASSDNSEASTNDALCALLCCCISRARKANKLFDQSMLAIPVDLRQRVKDLLPADYIGNAAGFASPVVSTSHLCEEDTSYLLPELAQLIRKSIQSVDRSSVENLLQSIAAVPNTTNIVWDIDLPGADVMCTNWTRTTLLDHSWGPELGSCAALRLPQIAVPGTCILLPRPVDGAIEVLIGLSVESTRVLQKDSEFMRHFDFICQ